MTDYFSLLRMPRRPWLEPDSVKQRFLALSSENHPDRMHGAAAAEKAAATRHFADLNGAWQCLREPKDRLGHLLELELGAKPADAQDVPAAAMDLFFETGQLCREADTFLETRAKTSSPLIKAQMFAKGAETSERLNGLQRKVAQKQTELMEELKKLDAAWENGERPLRELDLIYRMLSYVARASGQIQERIVRISF